MARAPSSRTSGSDYLRTGLVRVAVTWANSSDENSHAQFDTGKMEGLGQVSKKGS